MRLVSDPPTRRYRVVKDGDDWAVEQGGQALRAFPTREAAIAFACRAARQDAGKGWLGLVIAEAAPEEIHCFTPGQDDLSPVSRRSPRLVWSR